MDAQIAQLRADAEAALSAGRYPELASLATQIQALEDEAAAASRTTTMASTSSSAEAAVQLDMATLLGGAEEAGGSKLITVATCSLCQWALDFDGNLERIITSIRRAKQAGARYRVGPELEICGYGCEDHFYEQDTILHSWQSLAQLLQGDTTHGIICDVGMPVLHKNVRYNCRVFCLDGKVLLIRPKMCLADDGNYREGRWFVEWPAERPVEDFYLPALVGRVTGQHRVPIGFAALACADTALGAETCEELFTPDSPHIALSLDGVEIISNGSGSHHQLRKLDKRLDLLRSATAKSGGVYLYANQFGCDGGRLNFDGCALVVVNGDVVAQGAQFSVAEVEVVVARVCMEAVRSYRASVISRSKQAAHATPVPRVQLPHFALGAFSTAAPSTPIQPRLHEVEEEIAYGPAVWLWDYLRRSGAGGYFLPLSGGADSSSTAAIVGAMCQLLLREITEAPSLEARAECLGQVRRVVRDPDPEWSPGSAQELCGRVLCTCYMGTTNSSEETCTRARVLAAQLGADHLDARVPKYLSDGGNATQDLALQNIQARLRMVFSYMLAQLMPWVRQRPGFMLVLGSANVDEALRGYMTKYDCSSADVNPIGGISKGDLKRLLLWGARPETLNYPALRDVVLAPPTAELRPITAEYTQTDEEDMGMSYAELGDFGRLRKIERCGPVSMFQQLLPVWSAPAADGGRGLTPSEVADKVKRFFRFYAMNRHKLTTLTPSYHAESYSPDDNRFDLRQFLYNVRWPRQFQTVDALVAAAAAASPM